MKVHIISENSSDAELAQQALSFEGVIESIDSVSSATEGEVVVFDYDLGKKAIAQAIQSNPGPVYVVFYDDIKSKDQRELENGEAPPHALLKRPVTEEFLMDLLADFIDDSDSGPGSDVTKTKTNPDLGELTFIGQKKIKAPGPAKVDAHTDDDEEENDIGDVSLHEFKMSTDIKDIIKKHSLSPERTPNLDSKENQSIQKKFDAVFPEAAWPEAEEKGTKFKPIDEELLRGISEDIKPIDAVSLDLDGDVEDLSAAPEPKAKAKSEPEPETESEDIAEVIMMPEETEKVSKIAQPKKLEEAMSEPKSTPKEDASLMFDLGADLDKELVGDAKTAPTSTPAAASSNAPDKDDLDLGGLDLNLSDDAIAGAEKLEMGEEENKTTVFKGKSVELGGMELPGDNDGDLVFESASAGKDATSNVQEDEGLELEGVGEAEIEKPAAKATSKTESGKKKEKSSDDLDLDLDMNEEAPAKVAAGDEDEPIQEFDYKSSVQKGITKPAADDDIDINIEEDLDLDAASSEEVEDASDDISLDVEEEEEDDAPTRVLTDNQRKEAGKKKKAEVIDVSEGEDDGPMIIGSDKIPSATLNENDLVRLQSTIRHLKGERESLLKEVESLKEQKREVTQENIGLRTEIDDLRIEISIMRKRTEKDSDHVKEQLKAHEDRKSMYEEKLKQYQKEIERLNHKLRVDFTKVKQREKELESQLELQSMDSENQIKSRDKKILELKRKIDSLEFNMENASIREQKFREDKDKLEERMNKIIHTLRNSINVLEDDLDLDEETLEKLKKL